MLHLTEAFGHLYFVYKKEAKTPGCGLQQTKVIIMIIIIIITSILN